MKTKLILAAVAALAATSASAADLGKGKKAPPAPVYVSPWDFTVGAGVTSNYLFRGISQSNNAPSVNANAEVRYTFNDMFAGYVGIAGSSIKLTNQQPSPSMELDVMGGVRATLGAFTVDVGGIGYIYPNHTTGLVFPTNPTFWEGYVKTSYAVNDTITLGLNGFFTPSFLDTGADAQYIAGTFAAKLPMDFGFSAELGRQFFGRPDSVHKLNAGNTIDLPSYTYWNAGVNYTYKIATLDLRYHDTTLNKTKCAYITGTTVTGGSTSKYCGAAFVATLSFALTSKDLK